MAGLLPELEQSLVLRPGDMLRVTRDCSPAPVGANGVPWVGCTLPEVLDNARCGAKIYFDDGRIGGEIVAVDPDVLQVRVDRAAAAGSKLRAAKGINLPDETRRMVPLAWPARHRRSVRLGPERNPVSCADTR